MAGGDLRGKAEAQALTDGVGEVVPHGEGFVAVGADDEVGVVAADGGGVAGVGAIVDDGGDRGGELVSFRIVEPEDGEVEQLLVLGVKGFEFGFGGLGVVGLAAEVDGAQRGELLVLEIDGIAAARIVDRPVSVEREDEMGGDDGARARHRGGGAGRGGGCGGASVDRCGGASVYK